MAKRKIEIMTGKLSITSVGKNEVIQSLENKKVNDFEDGIEYYAAINNKCNVIVTEDIDDFYFAEIKVCRARNFLEEFLF